MYLLHTFISKFRLLCILLQLYLVCVEITKRTVHKIASFFNEKYITLILVINNQYVHAEFYLLILKVS